MTLEEINAVKDKDFPKFSSFAADQLPMPGVKKHLAEILNQEITILDFKIKKSKRREGTDCLQMQFIFRGEVCVLFTGSTVLMDQIKIAKEKNNVPFSAVVIKVDKYYSFE